MTVKARPRRPPSRPPALRGSSAPASYPASAACRTANGGPGYSDALWYPDVEVVSDAHVAICGSCPVLNACLEDALAASDGNDFGIRALTTARQRDRIRHARRMAAAA